VLEFLASKQLWAHPPYSLDLAPNDFFLFLKIKEILRGRHFDDIDDIRSNTTARPFHKTSSKIVLKGGLGAGIGAELPKGSTLKANTVIFSNEVCSSFTAMSSQTLLSNHAISTKSASVVPFSKQSDLE
jgi:hypothetical protein